MAADHLTLQCCICAQHAVSIPYISGSTFMLYPPVRQTKLADDAFTPLALVIGRLKGYSRCPGVSEQLRLLCLQGWRVARSREHAAEPVSSLLRVLLLLLLCFRLEPRLLVAPPLLPPDVRLVQVTSAVVACTNTQAAVCSQNWLQPTRCDGACNAWGHD